MKTLHLRLEKHYINVIAVKYGMMTIKSFDGLFHFEKYPFNPSVIQESLIK
jgi:hypothetical protein